MNNQNPLQILNHLQNQQKMQQLQHFKLLEGHTENNQSEAGMLKQGNGNINNINHNFNNIQNIQNLNLM